MANNKYMAVSQLLPSFLDARIDAIVARALDEDLSDVGDVTSQLLIPKEQNGCAQIYARQSGVIAGMTVLEKVASCVDKTICINVHKQDGQSVESNSKVATLSGPLISLLAAERVMLNFLGHMSGIATLTAQYNALIKHTKARLCCTRKTHPTLRMLQKYSVIVGGGYPHRYGLYDAILIKDNHIAACGGIRHAIEKVLHNKGHMHCVEIEVDTLEQLKIAIQYPIQAVLLDNMTCEMLREAVALIQGRIITEASGNICSQTIAEIAQTGVDYISVGRLTHSAPCLDFGLDM